MLRLSLALSLLLHLLAGAARAGSVTADSIMDRNGARQAAMEQVPRGATVTGSRCEDIQVGGFGLPRYRCTLWYRDQPASAPPAPAAAPSPAPSGTPAP